ncbi:hypothetical protein [Ottowia sp.]|uniref:hypothetical protein n=1 Tax=Ottowia sp. TaxID=1898956 RepID=UPI0025EFB0CF|nr:hypothetical protein [Ottowia sp.]
MIAPRTSRRCDELGVCQAHADRCQGCTLDTHRLPEGGFYFAPGTIEEPARRPGLLRAWLHVAAILAVLGFAGLISGYLHGRGVL